MVTRRERLSREAQEERRQARLAQIERETRERERDKEEERRRKDRERRERLGEVRTPGVAARRERAQAREALQAGFNIVSRSGGPSEQAKQLRRANELIQRLTISGNAPTTAQIRRAEATVRNRAGPGNLADALEQVIERQLEQDRAREERLARERARRQEQQIESRFGVSQDVRFFVTRTGRSVRVRPGAQVPGDVRRQITQTQFQQIARSRGLIREQQRTEEGIAFRAAIRQQDLELRQRLRDPTTAAATRSLLGLEEGQTLADLPARRQVGVSAEGVPFSVPETATVNVRGFSQFAARPFSPEETAFDVLRGADIPAFTGREIQTPIRSAVRARDILVTPTGERRLLEEPLTITPSGQEFAGRAQATFDVERLAQLELARVQQLNLQARQVIQAVESAGQPRRGARPLAFEPRFGERFQFRQAIRGARQQQRFEQFGAGPFISRAAATSQELALGVEDQAQFQTGLRRQTSQAVAFVLASAATGGRTVLALPRVPFALAGLAAGVPATTVGVATDPIGSFQRTLITGGAVAGGVIAATRQRPATTLGGIAGGVAVTTLGIRGAQLGVGATARGIGATTRAGGTLAIRALPQRITRPVIVAGQTTARIARVPQQTAFRLLQPARVRVQRARFIAGQVRSDLVSVPRNVVRGEFARISSSLSSNIDLVRSNLAAAPIGRGIKAISVTPSALARASRNNITNLSGRLTSSAGNLAGIPRRALAAETRRLANIARIEANVLRFRVSQGPLGQGLRRLRFRALVAVQPARVKLRSQLSRVVDVSPRITTVRNIDKRIASLYKPPGQRALNFARENASRNARRLAKAQPTIRVGTVDLQQIGDVIGSTVRGKVVIAKKVLDFESVLRLEKQTANLFRGRFSLLLDKGRQPGAEGLLALQKKQRNVLSVFTGRSTETKVGFRGVQVTKTKASSSLSLEGTIPTPGRFTDFPRIDDPVKALRDAKFVGLTSRRLRELAPVELPGGTIRVFKGIEIGSSTDKILQVTSKSKPFKITDITKGPSKSIASNTVQLSSKEVASATAAAQTRIVKDALFAGRQTKITTSLKTNPLVGFRTAPTARTTTTTDVVQGTRRRRLPGFLPELQQRDVLLEGVSFVGGPQIPSEFFGSRDRLRGFTSPFVESGSRVRPVIGSALGIRPAQQQRTIQQPRIQVPGVVTPILPPVVPRVPRVPDPTIPDLPGPRPPGGEDPPPPGIPFLLPPIRTRVRRRTVRQPVRETQFFVPSLAAAVLEVRGEPKPLFGSGAFGTFTGLRSLQARPLPPRRGKKRKRRNELGGLFDLV